MGLGQESLMPQQLKKALDSIYIWSLAIFYRAYTRKDCAILTGDFIRKLLSNKSKGARSKPQRLTITIEFESIVSSRKQLSYQA